MTDSTPATAAAFMVPTAGWYSFNGGRPVKLTDSEVAAMLERMANAVVVDFDTEPIDTAATMIDVRTLGELRDAVARLIEAHGEALPVHSYNDGMGCPEVTLHVTDHHTVGLIVEVM